MTLGEAVKKRRKQQGVSQKGLAALLDVSDMTISRLEADQNIRLSNNASEKLATFLGNDYIEQVSDDSPTARRLAAHILENYGEIIYPFPKDLLSLDLISLEYDKYITLITSYGIPVVQADQSSWPHNNRAIDLHLTYDNKFWALDHISRKRVGTITRLTGPYLYEKIGRAASDSYINKYSLIIDSDLIPPYWNNFLGAFSKQLNFDVSLLLFNRQTKRFECEMDLAFHDDGRGFFDLNVPGKEAESAKLYAAWKSSFAK